VIQVRLPASSPSICRAHEERISHKVIWKSFCKSQFPHKSVNLFFRLVLVKDKFTNLWGIKLLQNDFKNTLREIRSLNPKPQPPNSTPWTHYLPNPKIQTLNPQPSTTSPEHPSPCFKTTQPKPSTINHKSSNMIPNR